MAAVDSSAVEGGLLGDPGQRGPVHLHLYVSAPVHDCTAVQARFDARRRTGP